MIARDHDVGKAFIVAQEDVEARAQPLDEVRFQKQGFGFRASGDEFHLRGFAHHLRQTVGMNPTLRIIRDTLLQAAGLAHIQHIACFVELAINARCVRQMLHELGNKIGALEARLVLPALVPLDARQR